MAVGDKSYNAETVQTIYSSGKSIESIAMAMLYGKGVFKFFSALISKKVELMSVNFERDFR